VVLGITLLRARDTAAVTGRQGAWLRDETDVGHPFS
jgi:hypothetical protein